MFKKILIMGLLLTLAVTAQAVNIAVIDVDQILKDYPLVNQLEAQLRSQFASKEKQLSAGQEALQSKIDDLKRNGAIMTDTQRQNLAAEIDADKDKLQTQQSKFNDDLQAAQGKAMRVILGNINTAVTKIAKAKNYQIILQKDRTVYIDDSLDITKQVESALKAAKTDFKGLPASTDENS